MGFGNSFCLYFNIFSNCHQKEKPSVINQGFGGGRGGGYLLLVGVG